jgi:hypothetical protein
MFEHKCSYFASNGSETSTKILIPFEIGGNVEGGSMAIVEIVEVSMEVSHVVDNKTGQLSTCCLNCGLSIMKQSEVRSTECSIFILLFDKCNLYSLREEAKFSLDCC